MVPRDCTCGAALEPSVSCQDQHNKELKCIRHVYSLIKDQIRDEVYEQHGINSQAFT